MNSVPSQKGVFPNPPSNPESIFSTKPAAEIDGDKLWVDKKRVKALVADSVDPTINKKDLLDTIIGAIRSLFARILQALRSLMGLSTGSGGPVAPETAAAAGHVAESGPVMTENDKGIGLEGVGKEHLPMVKDVVEQLVAEAVGRNLTPSLQAALRSEDLLRPQATRVLLQSNCENTLAVSREKERVLSILTDNMSPFADHHGVSAAAILALYRAELKNGGTIIGSQVDPKGESVGYIGQLDKLDAAACALLENRGRICREALRAGALSADELVDVVEAAGLDPAFIRAIEAKESGQAQAVETIESPDAVQGTGQSNVVAVDFPRARLSLVPNPAKMEPLTEAREAAEVLVEDGVLSKPDAEALLPSAAIQAVVDDPVYDVEIEGDDLAGILNRVRDRPKNGNH